MTGMTVSWQMAVQVLREQWKNRFFQLILIFGAFIVYSSLLLGKMAVEQEGRVLLDFGAGLIEFVALAAMIFGCASAVLKDMESKTIYLILSRPVPRWAYIVGKYAGIVMAVGTAILCMGALHAMLLEFRGAAPGPEYVGILFSAWLKAALLGSVAVLVSLISTSLLSAVIISFILWTLGYFIPEARFMADHLSGVGGLLAKPFLYAVPNLALFNYKDTIGVPGQVFPGWGAVVSYTVLYSSCCVLFAIWLFRKKEF